MATRFGKFSDLVDDREPITGEEAWEVLKKLGLLGQEFVPGATSIRKLMEGEPVEAASEFNNWIPSGKAVENFVDDKPQDWMKNLIDAAIMAKPLAKGAKKVAEVVESIPKGGKEGFINLTKPTGQNKLKDVIEASNAAGQTVTPEIEKEIRDHIGLINQMKRNPSRALQRQVVNHYDRCSPEAKQVIDGYLGQEQMHGFKPEGFNDWSASDRMKYYEDQLDGLGMTPEEVIEKAKRLKDDNYAGHQDYGVIYSDAMTSDDYMKALLDKEAEDRAPIEMTQVEDLSTGIIPTEGSSVSLGRTRQSYDHSRPFMDTELRQVPGIDRTGMSYGDDTDAFFDIFQAWKNNPGNEEKAINKVIKEAKRERNDRARTQVDPYYNAGVIGDSNNRLWAKINELREEGLSDAEIRSLLKDQLDAYQGDLERFKARMPSKQEAAQFILDGAKTNTLRALPSEEARALEALGITTPEYDKLEQLGNFYRILFGK